MESNERNCMDTVKEPIDTDYNRDPNPDQVDIVFLTLPRLELRAPITAPAILKSMVENNGYKALCYDLNLDLWESIDVAVHGHVWFDTDLTFRYEDKFNVFWDEVIKPVSVKWISRLSEVNPSFVGLTLFSQRSSWIGLKISELLKEKLPHVKVIAGGPFADKTGAMLYKRGLLHAYVVGEGELAILEILKGNLDYHGINGRAPMQIDDLNLIPIPDYSDFEIARYPKTWFDPRVRDENQLGTEFVYITGSRGCVRKCQFCDIGSIWPKFRYRTGVSIANEMMEQNNRIQSRRFLFTDSLINGSVKQLSELCNVLIDYRDRGLMKPVIWQGQFIARPKSQMPEEVYAKMRDAGCFFVSIGIESGSEKVRNDMQKMFDDDALDFTLNMCVKHNIEMAWLLLVGYPTETEEEFQKTLDMLSRYKWMKDRKMVRSVALGPTLDIVRGSPLHDKQTEIGITWDENGHWVYGNNTRETRIKRWLRLKEHCLELGYPVVEKATDHLLKELSEITKKKQQSAAIYDHYNEIIGPMGPSV